MCCNEMMDFPNTFEEFAKIYSFYDTKQEYTNGVKLIPVFRVEQWLDHLHKNDENTSDEVSTHTKMHDIAQKLRYKYHERMQNGKFEAQDVYAYSYNYLSDLISCLPDGTSLFTVIADLIDPINKTEEDK